MHADAKEVKLTALVIDGVLMLSLGLVLLYLRGIMTNVLFDVIAIATAVVLAGAAFFMIALVDFGAALGFGISRRPRALILYSLLGIAFASGGAYLVYGPPDAIQVLLLFTITHGLVSGFLGFAAARRPTFSGIERILLNCFAATSVCLSGAIAGLADTMDDRSAMGWIGAYLCFVAVKLFLLAGASRRPSRLVADPGP